MLHIHTKVQQIKTGSKTEEEFKRIFYKARWKPQNTRSKPHFPC